MVVKGAFSIIETKDIGDNTVIGDFVKINDSVHIGDNVMIHDYVKINSGVIIEDNAEIFPFSLLGKEPKGAGTLLRAPFFSKEIKIGSNSVIGPHATLYYDVKIGNNTLVGDNASIRELSTVGKYCIIARGVTVNYNAHIGDYTKIMDSTHVTGNCHIGKHVFIGMLVSMANDNSLGVNTYIEEEEIGPTIEDYAMIGEGVSILPKIRIGSHSVVGAGSVVTKDVLENSLFMGVPAQFVRHLSTSNK